MARAPDPAPTAVVLGCGAVGSALAAALHRAGVPVVLWSRTAGRAAALAERLADELGDGGRVVAASGVAAAWEAAGEAVRVALVCVTDAALAAFVDELAAALPSSGPGEVVLHTNGARGLGVLAPLARAGFGTGKLHPLVAVPPRAGALGPLADSMTGAWFATCADERAAAPLAAVVERLGARSLALPADDATSRRLHSAAALLSGGLVALHAMATSIATPIGDVVPLAPRDAERVDEALRALLLSTARNVVGLGATAALTGPAARGAVDVVRAHLEALEAVDPEAARAYRLLGRRMLALGVERGSVEAGARAALERLLAD